MTENKEPQLTLIEALHTLLECREFVGNYSDVKDGDYGNPVANDAMKLEQSINETITKLKTKLNNLYGILIVI